MVSSPSSSWTFLEDVKSLALLAKCPLALRTIISSSALELDLLSVRADTLLLGQWAALMTSGGNLRLWHRGSAASRDAVVSLHTG